MYFEIKYKQKNYSIDGHDYAWSNININLRKCTCSNLSRHKDKMISELSGGEFKLIQVIKEMFFRS